MIDLNMIAVLLSVGAVVGMLAGLLGVGGGTVIVPMLIWILHSRPEIPQESIMHIALASSLATIMFTSVSSILAHHKRGAILWPIAIKLAPGLVIGVTVGSAVAGYLSTNTLKIVFGVFLLIISAHLGFGGQPAAHWKLPKLPTMSLAGFLIGKLSALVGIGGGSMTVPFLVMFNVSMRNAVATSAACGFPIAAAGTIGYIASGWNENLPLSTGYVYWPAVLAIASVSLFVAPLGAKLAHNIPVGVLKKFFAVFLAAIGAKMLMG